MSEAPEKKLVSFCYDLSGGMSGGFDRTAITAKNKRKCLYCTSLSVWHYQAPREHKKKLPIALLQEIEAVFRKYGLQNVTEAPLSEITALDAPTAHYSFDFGGDRYSFSSDRDYPDDVRTALNEIRAIVTKPKEDKA